jgi:hypothetical protein
MVDAINDFKMHSKLKKNNMKRKELQDYNLKQHHLYSKKSRNEYKKASSKEIIDAKSKLYDLRVHPNKRTHAKKGTKELYAEYFHCSIIFHNPVHRSYVVNVSICILTSPKLKVIIVKPDKIAEDFKYIRFHTIHAYLFTTGYYKMQV